MGGVYLTVHVDWFWTVNSPTKSSTYCLLLLERLREHLTDFAEKLSKTIVNRVTRIV